MARILPILLIVSLLSQAFIRTVWTLDYQWNRAEYLAQCENRDKPDLHCDGQCCLKKQIAVSENRSTSNSQEPQLPDNFRQFKDSTLFFESYGGFPVFKSLPEISGAFPPFAMHLTTAPSRRLLKPPAA